jgi:hypothetical protein
MPRKFKVGDVVRVKRVGRSWNSRPPHRIAPEIGDVGFIRATTGRNTGYFGRWYLPGSEMGDRRGGNYHVFFMQGRPNGYDDGWWFRPDMLEKVDV